MQITQSSCTLVNLPADVHSCIFRNLSLGEIGCIRQTCTGLNASISEDKQLWLHVLERDIRSKALPLPRLSQNIEKASASDVIQWIKNSVEINKNYSSGDNFTVVKRTLSLGVTWIRLIRGRWCLIACSDLDVSQIHVWDLQNLSDQIRKATFHLPGPVVDGIVEDTSSEILFALTVGKRVPSILILQLFTDGEEIRIRQLTEIPGASHIRLLHRPYIGFAVFNGDDTYPTILNWETGYSRQFIHPESVNALPIVEEWGCYIKNEPCTGMFLWGSYIFVIFPQMIGVFGQDRMLDYVDDNTLTNAAYLQVYHMSSSCSESCIVEDGLNSGVKAHQSVLHLLRKCGRGSLALLTVQYDESIGAPQKFVFDSDEGGSAEYLNLPPVAYTRTSTRMFRTGPSSQRAIALAINEHCSWPRPCLYTPLLKRPDHSVGFGSIVRLSSKGLPLLYGVSSMDFDDGCGLFVIGTIKGEVYVRSFSAAFSPASLDNDLPVKQEPSDFKDALSMKLPHSYELCGATSQDVREAILTSASHAWISSTPVPHVPGWSSDWSSFRNTAEWISVFARWGVLDKFTDDELISSRIRTRLGTLGEIIPVMYDEETHYRIVFRIGDRMYYCKSRNSDIEYAYDQDFECVDYEDVLGILPITFTRFLGLDAASLQDIISDRRTQCNLYRTENNFVDGRSYCQTRLHDRIRKSVTEQYGEYPGDEVLEAWTEEEWTAMRKIAFPDAPCDIVWPGEPIDDHGYW